jgi:WXG100 family type VII secretion target
MSDGYTVIPAAVQTAAAQCTTTADEVQSQLSTLKQYIVNMEAWWGGIASGQFQELMAEWDVYATMLYQALTDFGTALMGNYTNYTDTEQTNLTSVQTIQNEISSAKLT